MKNYKFTVLFGNAENFVKVFAFSIEDAAILAVSDRIKNGLTTRITKIQCDELEINKSGYFTLDLVEI